MCIRHQVESRWLDSQTWNLAEKTGLEILAEVRPQREGV